MKERGDGKLSCSLITKDKDGKEYSWFIYEKTLTTAIERFKACYGAEPNDFEQPLIMAGFRYVKTRKDSTDTYKVVGRIYIAPINKNGLIGRNMHEVESLDAVNDVLRKDKDLKFFIADVGEQFWGYFEKKGKPKKMIIAYADSEYSDRDVYKNNFEKKSLTMDGLMGFLNGSG